MTVSRALRPGPKKLIHPETLAHIQKIAKNLNYQPHTSARALSLQKTFNIGFCISHPGFNYYDRAQHLVFTALQKQLNDAGYHMGFYYFDPEHPEQFDVFLNRHRTVDAIIVRGFDLTPAFRKILSASDIHAVSFHSVEANLPSIASPNYEIGQRAAELIFQRGFRAMTFLQFRSPKWGGARVKKVKTMAEGLMDRAKILGLEVQCMQDHWDPVYDPSYALREGKPAENLIDRLLASGESGRCVFVTQDQYPLKIMQQMIRRGLKPGKDISFVGVGNIEPLGWGPWKTPRLTTFDPQRNRIAECLASLVMNDKAPPKAHTIPPLLIERDSLGWYNLRN